jgi:hypothetical protein
MSSKLLLEIIEETPNLLSDVKEIVDMIDGKAARYDVLNRLQAC